MMDILTENDKISTDLGWVKKTDEISQEQVNVMANLVALGSQTTTDTGTVAATAKDRRDIGLGHEFMGLL